MYYALLDMRSSCTALTGLVWGKTLKEVADSIIGECEMLMENTDDMSMEELEEEYYCEFDDYKELVDCDNPTFEMINRFSFALSDCTTDVGCLVEGYAALVEAFAEYTEDKMTLDEWSLIPEIDETEDNISELDEELRSLNEDVLGRGEYRFFVSKYADEEDSENDED